LLKLFLENTAEAEPPLAMPAITEAAAHEYGAERGFSDKRERDIVGKAW
jgi:hypothetical protein